MKKDVPSSRRKPPAPTDAAQAAGTQTGGQQPGDTRKWKEDWHRILEEALRRRESLTMSILDNLPIGVAVNSVDPTVDFKYMNENFVKFYRTTRQALTAPDSFWDAIYHDPGFSEEMRKRVLEDCASGDPSRMHWEDVPIDRQGQRTTYVSARNDPIPEKGLMLSSVWDVTARKEAELALRESEQRFRALFDNSVDAIIIVSAGGSLLEVNQAWLDMFQYSRDDLKSLNSREDVYADPDVRERLLQDVAELGALTREVKFKRKDGAVFDARLKVTSLFDQSGSVVLYQCIITDITELSLAEDRERDQRVFAAALMETSPACVIVFDIDRRIVFANAEADRVLGIPREQVLGMTCGDDFRLLDPNGTPLPEERLPGCYVFKTETPMYGVEYAFDSPTGRRMLSVSAAPVHDETSTVTGVVTTVEDITARKRMEEDLWRSNDIRSALNEILELSLSDLSLESILERSLIHILSIPWFGFESTGAIFLVEDEADMLVMKAQLGLAEPIRTACARVPFGRCFCGRAALTKEPQFTGNSVSGHETMFEGMRPHGHYCVPILLEDSVRGVVCVYVVEGQCRDGRAQAFLAAAANTLAGIVERKRREKERENEVVRIQAALTATVDVMSAAVELRDPYTAGHQLRVTIVARAIAEQMGLSDEAIRAVEVAGRVHDLGKLRIPAEILTKPGKLVDAEYQLIREHPQASYDLLKGIDFSWPVAEIAWEHHERLDGSGYPRGLKGEEILPEARILAVADVFEAMSSHRPYRPTLGTEAAMKELETYSGTRYDPAVVEALSRLVREKGFGLE